MTSPRLFIKTKTMTLLIIILAFLGGMVVEKKYSPRLTIKDNHFGLAYSAKGVTLFKKIL